MSLHTAEAIWHGNLTEGKGHIKSGSGSVDSDYSLKKRTGEEKGTNPEELIGAAHAGCFSMALAAALTADGVVPKSIHTKASVTFDKVADGFAITKIALVCEAEIPGIDAAKFKQFADGAKTGCPVSKALSSVPITLEAKLLNA